MNSQIPNTNSYTDDERPIDLHDLWHKFLRRRKLFLYIAIPIFLGILISQLTKSYNPIYRATFDLGITSEQPVEGFLSGTGYLEPTMQIGTVSQRVISNLLSVNLAQKVADTAKLYAHIENGNSGAIRIEVEIKKDFEKKIGPLRLEISPVTIHEPEGSTPEKGSRAFTEKGSRAFTPVTGRFSLYSNGNKIKDGLLNEFVDFEFFKLKIISRTEITGSKIYKLTIYPRYRMALALRNSISAELLEADKIEKGIGSSGIPFSGEASSKKLVTANPRVYNTEIGILRINVHWGNPDDALIIARALSTQIIDENKQEKSLQYVQSQTFIDSQLVLYENKLTALEEEIKQFKELKKIADLKASTHALINQVSGLESKKNQLQIEQKILDDLSAYLVSAKGSVDQAPNFASAMVSDRVLQDFYSQLLDAEAELRARLKEYSKGHPKVIVIQAKLDGLKDQMKEEIAKRIPSINTEIQSVENQILTLQSKLKNVPDDEIQLARLERDKETAEKLYTFFAEKLEETRVQEARVTSDLRIINPPIVSGRPVNSKRTIKNTFIAFIISILTGVFAVFIAEYLDQTVKDPDIVAEKIGLPIFASIPVVDEQPSPSPSLKVPSSIEGKRKSASGGGESTNTVPSSSEGEFIKTISSPLKGEDKGGGVFALINDFIRKNTPNKSRLTKGVVIVNPSTYSAEFEAFRKLSINLEFAHPEEKYKVIYLTSTGPDEGKTFISLNLGLTLGMTNRKIIVIDTDFRKKRGSLTDIAGMRKKPGLFDILKGEVTPEEVVLKYNVPNDQNEPNLSRLPRNDSVRGSSKEQRDDQNVPQGSVEILPVGKVPPNPFVFLDSDQMKSLITELKSRYDYILIDGVPLVLFADASYLANFADGVFLTARYAKTSFKELEYSRDMLLSSKSNIIGIIMNAVPKTREGYYYYHHYYYHKYYPKYYKKE
jgi:uncharacterized protein involved in exopolysaccharide biosynthesis/Mrp family chromosome partitioning ATPase